ncbi:MAG: molybdopterin-dependent oxidoreductase [Alphaproteobacteria bacterium]|nr:molybdopterin-dependent oxidoreductase [Alphaproteobacteria bacterium]
MPRSLRTYALALVAGLGLLAASAGAADLAKPSEKPILTVTGKIGVTNSDKSAVFDRAMLESLGMTSFTTATPWYKEPVTFEGVPLAKLMEAVGATGDRFVAVALNDYSAELPMEDVKKYPVILALKRDGQYMPVRDKGPLFIVYHYDSNPDLKNQKFYSRSVWQVARIEVK